MGGMNFRGNGEGDWVEFLLQVSAIPLSFPTRTVFYNSSEEFGSEHCIKEVIHEIGTLL